MLMIRGDTEIAEGVPCTFSNAMTLQPEYMIKLAPLHFACAWNVNNIPVPKLITAIHDPRKLRPLLLLHRTSVLPPPPFSTPSSTLVRPVCLGTVFFPCANFLHYCQGFISALFNSSEKGDQLHGIFCYQMMIRRSLLRSLWPARDELYKALSELEK